MRDSLGKTSLRLEETIREEAGATRCVCGRGCRSFYGAIDVIRCAFVKAGCVPSVRAYHMMPRAMSFCVLIGSFFSPTQLVNRSSPQRPSGQAVVTGVF